MFLVSGDTVLTSGEGLMSHKYIVLEIWLIKHNTKCLKKWLSQALMHLSVHNNLSFTPGKCQMNALWMSNHCPCTCMQLKSMISALHHSRVDGTKPNRFRLWRKGTEFGWEAIEGMLRRQIQRIQSGQLARVPGLKENFVHRDSWTRLNVKPAKIMQALSTQDAHTVTYSHHKHLHIHVYSKSMLLKLLLLWKVSVFRMSFSTSKLARKCLTEEFWKRTSSRL